jgi:hypothetical protein
MKNTIKLFGTIVLATVIGFSMAACGDEDKGGPPLEGLVYITGSVAMGQPLSVNTNYLKGTGTISYQWKRGSANVGTNSDTYTSQTADVGSKITVTVTHDGYSGSITSDATAVIGISSWTFAEDLLFNSTNTFLRNVAWGKDKFVAVGQNGHMRYSADGVTWTVVEDNKFPDTIIVGIAWGGSTGQEKFVAGGWDGKMSYSPDGITWTAVEDSTFGGSNIYGIAWGNNKFVAVGRSGKMAYSPDGITWTAVTNSTFNTITIICGIAWGNGKFVAVAESGKMAYSSNGTAWTAVTDSTFGTGDIYDIAWGNDKFVAVGGRDGKMAHSADGVTWIAVADSKIPYFIYGIAWGDNKFVAVGSGGNMAYSPNGTGWTAVTSIFPTGSDIHGIAWGNGKFVAVGNRIAYSTTGE